MKNMLIEKKNKFSSIEGKVENKAEILIQLIFVPNSKFSSPNEIMLQLRGLEYLVLDTRKPIFSNLFFSYFIYIYRGISI